MSRTVMNAKQLAAALSLSTRSIIKLRLSGRIPFFKIGDSVRYIYEDVLDALLANHEQTK